MSKGPVEKVRRLRNQTITPENFKLPPIKGAMVSSAYEPLPTPRIEDAAEHMKKVDALFVNMRKEIEIKSSPHPQKPRILSPIDSPATSEKSDIMVSGEIKRSRASDDDSVGSRISNDLTFVPIATPPRRKEVGKLARSSSAKGQRG